MIQTPSLAAAEAPAWLKQAAAQPAAAYPRSVPAVVLWNERSIQVGEGGKVTTFERYAVRILSVEGRREAHGVAVYTRDTGRVRDVRGWVISPNEEVKKLGREKVIDRAAAYNDIYDEVRLRILDGEGDVEPGAVFGYETIVEDRSVFTQFDWQFQNGLPTLLSRFAITLPAGWRADSVMFNHQKVEPQVNGTTYVWELRDLPFVEREPAGPPLTNLVPILAVSYFPASGDRAGLGISFANWVEVSRWLTELSDQQAVLNDAMIAKARELTASAKTALEKIQAIGRYCQNVNYISIQTGVGRGGGYRPHSSVEVFTKSYGDCKDKANLMRALLKAVGITSYLVCIYSGDPTYVKEQWPSPQQFNHCIIAVKVGEETKAPTVISHPTIGRLLIFDPTDDNTPVGDLPDHEQNSLALLIAGDQGALLRMPVTPPEMNHLERRVDATLSADGSIAATVIEKTVGHPAVVERRDFRGLSRPDYLKMIEKWLTRGATGASVSKVEPVDNGGEGRFSLDVVFTAPRYAQVMQGRLLVFKPAVVSRRESLALTEKERRHPVMIDSHAYTETVRIKLPDGFAVDELPEAVNLKAAFGSYSTRYEIKGGVLHFTRSLTLRRASIPASEYEGVRSFFSAIRVAEQAPVVLAKR